MRKFVATMVLALLAVMASASGSRGPNTPDTQDQPLPPRSAEIPRPSDGLIFPLEPNQDSQLRVPREFVPVIITGQAGAPTPSSPMIPLLPVTLTPTIPNVPVPTASPTASPLATVAPPIATTVPTVTPIPNLPTPTPAFLSPPNPPPIIQATTLTNVLLLATRPLVSVGEQFSVDVVVQAGVNSPVDTMQVYLDFDSVTLEVTGIRGGATLDQILQSSYENGSGQVNYAAGTLKGGITDPFILLTIDFRARAATGSGGTTLGYAALAAPRETKAIRAGVITTGTLTPVSIVVE